MNNYFITVCCNHKKRAYVSKEFHNFKYQIKYPLLKPLGILAGFCIGLSALISNPSKPHASSASWKHRFFIMHRDYNNSLFLWCPRVVISTAHILYYLMNKTTLWGMCYFYPDFIDGKTGLQGDHVICQRLILQLLNCSSKLECWSNTSLAPFSRGRRCQPTGCQTSESSPSPAVLHAPPLGSSTLVFLFPAKWDHPLVLFLVQACRTCLATVSQNTLSLWPTPCLEQYFLEQYFYIFQSWNLKNLE